jgi:threonine aldolase
MDFTSDNIFGAHPKILAAIIAANAGPVASYGEDPFTQDAAVKLAAIFEHEAAVFLVTTGTAANALALGAICPPWGAVFCHEDAHISEDECGAPEMFTAGAKIVGIRGFAGKIAPADFKRTLASFPRGLVKQVQPAVLSLSQLTEAGTAYSCEEIATLTALAHDAGLKVHMDGARFANALVAQNCSPAAMSWQAGIDVLSLGATKNGALACEAVIFFDPALAEAFGFQRKRAGHTVSKGRFLGAQMLAYLDGGLWLELAKIANGCAARLVADLAKVPGIRLPWAPAANEIFAIMPRSVDAALKAAGARYYDWSLRDYPSSVSPPGDEEVFIRLVTSYATTASDIEHFIAAARGSVKT